jgi:hypothetical protein
MEAPSENPAEPGIELTTTRALQLGCAQVRSAKKKRDRVFAINDSRFNQGASGIQLADGELSTRKRSALVSVNLPELL